MLIKKNSTTHDQLAIVDLQNHYLHKSERLEALNQITTLHLFLVWLPTSPHLPYFIGDHKQK